jgi:phosphonoacetaldehyde dehydrogenase
MAVLELQSYVAGEPVQSDDKLEVNDPYTGEIVGIVSKAGPKDLNGAIERALECAVTLTRYQRHEILNRARTLLLERSEEFSGLITSEAGLCKRESVYEVGRACDVLQFASIEALHDDGQIFSCDISPQGKARKIFTIREPLPLTVAITPFNHPLNQVAHKLAPAIAAGTPTILKPSEKTPLTAIRFVELLYEAGLPATMLSVLLGDVDEIVEPMVTDPRVSLVSFTGGVPVGKRIAEIAGYKKTCLELGGNAPLIVLDDANMELAVKLAAEGCYRNSGQRCTAVKRLLIHEKIHNEFVELFVEKSKEYICGNPKDPKTRVGTVIDENSAKYLEAVVNEAVELGAKVLLGGKRTGAQIEPTVLVNVPRLCKMVVEESFGPLAPIMKIKDLDDAIDLTNSTAFGLSSGIVTRDMELAIKAIKRIRTGTVNVNEVPGYRIESSPFGGVKDSGLGVKEGVIEAIKTMTTVKTFSLPW